MLVGQGADMIVGHQGDMGVYHSLLAVWPASATSVAVLVPSAAPVTLLEARTPLGLARTLHQLVAG
jgi:hypothetical protein